MSQWLEKWPDSQGMKPVGEGGHCVQHPPSDLAKPPEAADFDCNNSVLVSINLAIKFFDV